MPVSLVLRSSGSLPRSLRLAITKVQRCGNSSQLCRTSSYSYQRLLCLTSTTTSSSSKECPVRCFSTSGLPLNSNEKASVQSEEVRERDPYEVDPNDFRERYIPINRQTVIRSLMEEKNFFSEEEKKLFPGFARALDRSLINHYKGVLTEIKTLFDPINPDCDTLQTRRVSRREKLDNEFWLLQQLHEVMKRANFQELPPMMVKNYLKEHMSKEGVKVSVDWDRYDVLRFWVLGHEMPKLNLSLLERLTNRVLGRQPRSPVEYYKRVVVAVRLKKDSKLILKAFKEVPAQDLAMLLPDGSLQMSTMDKGIFVTSLGIAGVGILAKVVSHLAALHVEWPLVVAAITGMVSFRAWTMYRNKRNEYMIKVTQMLYYKNIANNRSLLAVLVDRAEDEVFKEALLTYAFLLTSRPMEFRGKAVDLIPVLQRGGLRREAMETDVSKWLKSKTGAKIQFDSLESLPLLEDIGLVYESNYGGGREKLSAVSLEAALRLLPPVSVSTLGIERGDLNIVDGFDRDVYLETEEEYKKEEERRSKYGWF